MLGIISIQAQGWAYGVEWLQHVAGAVDAAGPSSKLRIEAKGLPVQWRPTPVWLMKLFFVEHVDLIISYVLIIIDRSFNHSNYGCIPLRKVG